MASDRAVELEVNTKLVDWCFWIGGIWQTIKDKGCIANLRNNLKELIGRIHNIIIVHRFRIGSFLEIFINISSTNQNTRTNQSIHYQTTFDKIEQSKIHLVKYVQSS